MNLKKLIIGSAQFGMKYGVANKKGVPSDKELKKIFRFADQYNINSIDTAHAYGNCESRLGKLHLAHFNIYTKFHCNDDYKILLENVIKSCNRLDINSIEGILLHGIPDFESFNNCFPYFNKLKELGLTKKIGVSIYNPDELAYLLNNVQIDLLQIPLNILNRNSFPKTLLEEVKSRKIEIQVRSIFLQGLLLMDSSMRPNYFKKWSSLFEKWDKWLVEEKLSPIQACLSFALNNNYIDKVIIGIDSYQQLLDIVNEIKKLKKFNIPEEIFSKDKNLINPAMWKI